MRQAYTAFSLLVLALSTASFAAERPFIDLIKDYQPAPATTTDTVYPAGQILSGTCMESTFCALATKCTAGLKVDDKMVVDLVF